MNDALKFIADAADEPGDKPEDYATQAYRLYVLALAGKGRPGAARVIAEQLDQLPTPLAKAQLGAALALAHDQPRADAAFAAALAAPGRRWWAYDYGTALRDQVAIALLLKESGLPGDRLEQLLAVMPGADLSPDTLSTQEQSWAAAAGAVLGRNGAPARIALDGQRSAAGAGGVGGADRTRHRPQPGRPAGVARGLGHRHSRRRPCRRRARRCASRGSSRRWMVSRWTSTT